jgi:hypothetical protein
LFRGGRSRDLGENAERVAQQLRAGGYVLAYGDVSKLPFAGRGERGITLVDVKTVFGHRFFKATGLGDERWVRADEVKQFVEDSRNGVAVVVY